MFANFLIGLREGLEAALVIGILAAYLVKIDRRDLLKHMWAGVGIAVGISLAAGAALTYGPRQLSEQAEETIAGFLSLLAVALVTWMIFWLAKTARTLRASLESAVGGLALITVGREGLETALFVWAGINAADDTTGPVVGVALGIGLAAILGYFVSKGAIRLNLASFFRWTGVALIVLAAGVLTYAVHELQEAHIIAGEDAVVFNVRDQIPPDSWYGTVLKGIFNFRGKASVLEVIAYFAYLVPTLIYYIRTTAHRPQAKASHREEKAAAIA